jgi:sulfate/thiosulfate transport system permease protein
VPDTLAPHRPERPERPVAAPRRRPRKRGRASRTGLRTIVVLYVGILVAVPLFLVFQRTFADGAGEFWDAVSTPDAVHAFRLTAEIAFIAVVINTVFGIGVSILLARYRFPGRRLFNVLLDIPVSVSPIVVGLALVLVYGPTQGWFGPDLSDAGIQVIFATPGMVLATCFVSLPLVVRELVPVLQEEGLDQEIAARSLGANAWQRFIRITLPTVRWALAYGVVLSLARSIGEFGAVRVVSGDVIGETQTGTLRVADLAEQAEPGAYQIALVLVLFAIVCIVGISLLKPSERKH